jgi:D-alanine-D-alanine ligase
MNVTVLFGGPSSEREVSLVSGAAVIKALREVGHTVFESDISPTDLAGLDHKPVDVVFPVLHGEFGESGELQEILEARKLPFVGSGSAASRLGINKATTKVAWEKAGLPTPPYRVLTRADIAGGKIPEVGFSLAATAVKALDAGSSIDVHICKTAADTEAAIRAVLAKYQQVLVEKYIKGPELTVGLLEEKALAPIRIIPTTEFFDYQAKYQRSDTQHKFDTGLPAATITLCQQLAEKANAVVGAKDLARIDIMLDETDGLKPYLLEINTLPGFTPKSLLPEAANHAGINFGALVDRLVKRAAARGAR